MTTLYEGAFAKLNLTLDVLRKREDGYHDIKSIMQTISIRDDVEIDVGTGKPWSLECTAEGIPTDETNLAWKAAKIYCDEMKKDPDGLAIRIHKRIPSGAGLGGGSADAAAVLRALNKHYDDPLSLPDMPDCVFVVCKPEFSVSTPELYRKIDSVAIPKRPDHMAMESALLAGDIAKVADLIYNVFDPVVTAEHLEINYIKSICNSYGALGMQMTGSGSAVYAIMPSFEYAAVVCNMLKDNYPGVFIAKPV